MARLRALLLLALAALCSASTTCPAPSTGAVACYQGYTATVLPTTGGLCKCRCGANAAVAVGQDLTPVASTDACNSTLCATTYNVCVAYSNASFVTYATYLGTTAVPSAQPQESGQICYSWTKTCSVASPCTGTGLTAGSLTKYGAFGGNASSNGATVYACGADAAVYANTAAFTSWSFCDTDQCNAPPGTPAPPPGVSPPTAGGLPNTPPPPPGIFPDAAAGLSSVLATAVAAASAAMLL